MPWVEALADVNDLRRCIRDLVALSTLPAVWTNYGPSQIANSVAAALLSMLGADFVYVALPPDWGEPPIEAVHVDRRRTILSVPMDDGDAPERSSAPARRCQYRSMSRSVVTDVR